MGRSATKNDYVITVTPVEFFARDLKRLAPHLDFLSAVCFSIRINGPMVCEPEIEVWSKGERLDKPKYGFKTDVSSDEISFTIRQVRDSRSGKERYLAKVGGRYTFARYFDCCSSADSVKVAFGPISRQEPIHVMKGTDSVLLWAMGFGDPGDLKADLEGEAQLKKLPWVMILRLHVCGK
jgi:hypothetical protein